MLMPFEFVCNGISSIVEFEWDDKMNMVEVR